MTEKGGGADVTAPSPEEAFAVLGNETRVRTLQVLSEADGPVSFTELRSRVGLKQGAQFNYHLTKLVGHFVAKTAKGYILREPGRRVIQAIRSGAVTDNPVIGPNEVDWWSCPYCGGPVEVTYREERLDRYCTECAGYAGASGGRRDGSWGSLGTLHLPPAGVEDRTPSEALRAAFTWGYAEWLMTAQDVCPRCSAGVERSVEVCENHDADDGFCTACERRYAVAFRVVCPNCGFALGSIASMHLGGSTELLSFATDHGINPLRDPWDWGWEYEEELLETDPLEARFTFTIDDEALMVTVDESLSVVEAQRHSAVED